MIIGLMALLGQPGDVCVRRYRRKADGGIDSHERGIFSQVRPPTKRTILIWSRRRHGAAAAAADEIAAGVDADCDEQMRVARRSQRRRRWRYGYWLLVIAGAGHLLRLRRQKRAVSAARLVARRHGRPDARLGTGAFGDDGGGGRVSGGAVLPGLHARGAAGHRLSSGCITLFLAATIAITATDIKRVLAYSTVSQLGYMMLALGVGGWVAGLFHLITHAFFKSLLFMCSGSVIHACHTNDMTQMGGLRHKMPWTAYTMLVGCLAIIGAGIPFLDRAERLLLEGRDHRARRCRSRTNNPTLRLAVLRGRRRRGDHRVLHVPAVVS